MDKLKVYAKADYIVNPQTNKWRAEVTVKCEQLKTRKDITLYGDSFDEVEAKFKKLVQMIDKILGINEKDCKNKKEVKTC